MSEIGSIRRMGWRLAIHIPTILVAFLFSGPAAAAELQLQGAFTQGGLVRGVAAPGADVTLNGKPVALAPDGRFVLGFGRDAARTASLAVTWPDGRREVRALTVAPRAWRIQRVEGLAERKVSPPPQDLVRIKAESALLARVRHRATPPASWQGGFTWPASGRISGVYGSQRVLNGEPRQPHLGVDIAAPEGTPVFAAADGTVSLAHDDLFFTGRTVAIDHGLGLTSFYAHMSALTVAEGAIVKQGQMIGRVGKTGRVTGPHLHWSLTWFDERLDPSLALGDAPAVLGAVIAGPAPDDSGIRPAAMQP